ncbi:MAG TPA: DUF1178 family protein [Acidisoma sp.]|uniref:DUF1178 family protein n=1 Tax=Acidisoma sp. TaxID=1872115 RepID=UPI002B516B03|nr:DUF1178 family protein [Acidisoma sp.]HTI02903.1 DUF1178 family protein [Acidisoma sp.]
MIHYQLQCDHGHGFDGWFSDSASFERQAERGLIACPSCNSLAITRALMAPALGRKARHGVDRPAPPSTPAQPAEPPSQGVIPAPAMPDQLRALLQRMRAEVEKTCDDVGGNFAEEARRIHYGEVEARGIYGETTPSEAEALTEEGIDFGVLPWLPRSDS